MNKVIIKQIINTQPVTMSKNSDLIIGVVAKESATHIAIDFIDENNDKGTIYLETHDDNNAYLLVDAI